MIRILNRYYPLRNIIFFFSEGLLIFGAVVAATYVRFGGEVNHVIEYDYILLKAVLVSAICQLCLYYNDLYDFKVVTNNTELVIRLFQAIGSAYLILALIYFLFPAVILGRGIFVITLFFLICGIVSWRLVYNWILKSRQFDQRVLIVGTGELAQDLFEETLSRRDSGFEVVGFVENSEHAENVSVEGKVIGTTDDIDALVNKYEIEKIVVALHERRGSFPIRKLLECRLAGVDVEEGVTFYERLMGKIIVASLTPSWLIFSSGFKKSKIRRAVKRISGVLISVFGLIIASPILVVTALLIKLESRGPVIFKQERVGEAGKTFNVLKFRSMVQNAEEDGKAVWATENDPRVTRVGSIIRKLRIDEIPQLLNVLKGDMNLVGPRPERPEFVEDLQKEIPYYSLRHTVKPGVTGWAQIMYPYGSSVEDAREKLHFDLYYIKNMSMVFDLLIMFNTVKIVLFGRGAR